MRIMDWKGHSNNNTNEYEPRPDSRDTPESNAGQITRDPIETKLDTHALPMLAAGAGVGHG
jgi:hypothetical protein